MAIKIFRHAWNKLWNNLASAAKVSLFPIICTIVVIALAIVLLGVVTYLLEGFDNLTGTHVVMMVFRFLLVIWIYLVGFAWSLIGWHRFVLLRGAPKRVFTKMA